MASYLYEHTYVSSSLMLGYKFYNKYQTHIVCPISELAHVSPTFKAMSHFLKCIYNRAYSMVGIIHHKLFVKSLQLACNYFLATLESSHTKAQ